MDLHPLFCIHQVVTLTLTKSLRGLEAPLANRDACIDWHHAVELLKK